jgi:hypothetical protein
MSPYLRVSLSPHLCFKSPHLFFTIPPDLNGYIRTDLSADGTTCAGAIIIPDHIEIPLTVDLFSDPDLLLRARDGAETTTLTTLFINFNFRSHKNLLWNDGILE